MSNYPSAVFPYEDFPTAMQHNNGGMGYPMNSSLIDHNYQNQYSMNMNMPMSSHLQFGMPMQMPPQMSIPIQVGIPNQISMDNTPIESKPRMFGSPSSQEEFPLYSHSHSHSHSNSQAQLQLMSLSQSQSQVQIQTHQPQHRGSVAPPGVSPTDYARRQMAHINHVIGGLKATLANPHTSAEAKARARVKLMEAMETAKNAQRRAPILHEPVVKRREESDGEHRNRMIGGYRACLANPNAGVLAKDNARKMIHILTSLAGPALRQFFEDAKPKLNPRDRLAAEAHNNRIIGGHKAVLANSSTSQIAKEHSRNWLEKNKVMGFCESPTH